MLARIEDNTSKLDPVNGTLCLKNSAYLFMLNKYSLLSADVLTLSSGMCLLSVR